MSELWWVYKESAWAGAEERNESLDLSGNLRTHQEEMDFLAIRFYGNYNMIDCLEGSPRYDEWRTMSVNPTWKWQEKIYGVAISSE